MKEREQRTVGRVLMDPGVTSLEPTGQIAERVQNTCIYTVYIDIFCALRYIYFVRFRLSDLSARRKIPESRGNTQVSTVSTVDS